MELEIDISAFTALARSLAGAEPIVKEELLTAGRKAGFLLQAMAQVEAPVDTGHLRNTIGPPEITQTGFEVEVEVAAHAEYARAVHDGRRAVTIVPVNARALRFEAGGRIVFAKRVSQPARAGNPFMRRALDKSATQVAGIFGDALTKATTRALGR